MLLNFDKEQLSFDEAGIELIDEALKWNGTNYKLFDTWFPSVLAYYGQFYIMNKGDGQWTAKRDEDYNLWVPQVVLSDKTIAFDMRVFYKDIYEGPIPLKWAGDYDGHLKKMRSER
ncbi:MAG: hypothetical protein ACO1NX_01565 [Chitinophagaceae bacterium]